MEVSPRLCHQYINGTLTDTSTLQQLANNVNLSGPVTDLAAFTSRYLEVFSKGYNYAFGIAAGAMVISLLVYILFNKLLPNKERSSKETIPKIEFKPSILLYCISCNGSYSIRTKLSRRSCRWFRLWPFCRICHMDYSEFA